MNEVEIAMKFQKNDDEHIMFKEYIENDRHMLATLTASVTKMTLAITELVARQDLLLKNGHFLDTWYGKVILAFGILVVTALLFVSIGVNILEFGNNIAMPFIGE